MSDRDALLRAILDNPEDDAPRLIFADYIDERGEPERAEFIRLQIELATYPQTGLDRNSPIDMFGQRERRFLKWGKSRKALRKREYEYLAGDWRKIAPNFPLIMTRVTMHQIEGHAHVKFARGFIELVELSAADAIAHLDAILAAQPVQEVTLTTPPEIDISSRRQELRIGKNLPKVYAPMHCITFAGKDYEFSDIWLNGSPHEYDEIIVDVVKHRWPRIKKWNLPIETPEFPNSAETLARRTQSHPMVPLRGPIRRV